MTKDEAVKRLETIIANSSKAAGNQYKIKVRNWENFGKSRTYFSVIITRSGSRYYAERQYGYIDNQTAEYVSGNHDLRENYDLSGAAFEESNNTVSEEVEITENFTSSDIIDVVENIMSNFEESQKEHKDIEHIKAIHKTVLKNIKSADGGEIKKYFTPCAYNAGSDAVANWETFTYCLNRATKDGFDYRALEMDDEEEL